MLTPMKKISFSILILFLLVACSKEVIPDPTPQRTEISFSVGGHSYVLPVPYSTFKEQGWLLEDDESFVIPANSYLEGQGIRKDKYYLLTTFYNNSDEAKPLKDAIITTVQAENRYVEMHYKDDVPPNIIVKDIIDWSLPESEANSLFGMSAKLEENRVYRSYIYEFEDNQVVTLQYLIDSGQFQYLHLKDYGKGLQVN